MNTQVQKKENVQTEIVNFETLVAKYEEHQKKLSINPNYLKDGVVFGLNTLNKINQLKNKHIVNVHLEIPKEFYKELGAGKINRVAGALKHSQKQTFIKHLQEVKPSKVKKLTKAANIAFIALDVLESVIVDQKLKEILEIVKEINLKLDAQNRGALKSAIEQIKDLHLIQNTEIQQQKILLIQNDLSYCEQLFTTIYENKWNKYIELNNKYATAKITNSSELNELHKIGISLPNSLEPIIICKVAQTKLCEMQDEYVLAQDKAFNLAGFLSDKLDDYKNAFSDNSLDEKKKIYKNYGIQKKEKRFLKIKDELVEPNEKIEFLLNSTLCYALSIPEVIGQGVKKKDANLIDYTEVNVSEKFWNKIKKWFFKVINKIKIGISSLLKG